MIRITRKWAKVDCGHNYSEQTGTQNALVIAVGDEKSWQKVTICPTCARELETMLEAMQNSTFSEVSIA